MRHYLDFSLNCKRKNLLFPPVSFTGTESGKKVFILSGLTSWNLQQKLEIDWIYLIESFYLQTKCF